MIPYGFPPRDLAEWYAEVEAWLNDPDFDDPEFITAEEYVREYL